MKRLATAVACAALAVGALTACGGGSGSGDDYCGAVKDTQKELGTVSSSKAPSDEQFAKAISAFQDVAKKAPSNIKGEWKTVGDSLDKVKKALDDADLSISDLSDSSKAAKLTDAQKQKLTSAVSGMGNLSTSIDKITKNVKKECKVDLTKSSS